MVGGSSYRIIDNDRIAHVALAIRIELKHQVLAQIRQFINIRRNFP